MGLLVEGEWHEKWYETKKTGGRFVRSEAQFRNDVERDAKARFPAEAGRYHLYIADACPWCHRTMVARAVFGLDEVIPVTRVSPWMLEGGWRFEQPEPLYGLEYVHQLYTHADPDYTGRVTVPVLWDTQQQTIANNESSEIIRFFDQAFRHLHTREVPSWRPPEHSEAIDGINPWVYRSINNGVYRCGFATTQEAYDEASAELFEALDRAEAMLEGRDYLVADHPTEADWRLWVTLIRFDLVYFGHFKCNVRRIADYPNLQGLTKRLYVHPGVADTVDFDSIKTHYYGSHETINPHRIVPRGPELDF